MCVIALSMPTCILDLYDVLVILLFIYVGTDVRANYMHAAIAQMPLN